MTTREWLNRGFSISRALAVKKASRDTLANVISRYEASETQTDHGNSAEDTAIRWSECQREIERLELELRNIDIETNEVLSHLDNLNEFNVLYCRYIRRLTWTEIAQVMNYSSQHIFKLHCDGVKNCAKYMESVRRVWV